MTISAGSILGPYEIVEPIGSGGMGEVFKARDTRLDRDVAVKVLPESVALNEQLLYPGKDANRLAHLARSARPGVGADRGEMWEGDGWRRRPWVRWQIQAFG